MFIILEKNIHTSNPLITNEPCKKIKKPVNQAFDIFFLKGQKKKLIQKNISIVNLPYVLVVVFFIFIL